LRARFDGAPPFTIGIEDEVMVLDPDTLELAPRAPEVLSRLGDDPRYKLELPAAQLEILVEPTATVPAAAQALLEARRDLATRVDGAVRFGSAGVHPTSPGAGELNRSPRYDHTVREYGLVAARQLVCAFQVHVAVPGADRALAVYNAARAYLPSLAALAANAPFYEGQDTGLASVRAKIGELLPRQGVPPAFENWEEYAGALAWGARTGAFPGASSWWYELRLHPRFGTLELRVPDAQITVGDAAAIAAVAQALLAWLAERHDSGDLGDPVATWRIEQNRWWACRDGVDGDLADLDTGELRPTRERLRDLLVTLEPLASRLGGSKGLIRARELVECNGAIAQRREAARVGISSVPGWLASKFLEP
jgi:glutamate---cysteine ligase / carboxylate-amine ligase